METALANQSQILEIFTLKHQRFLTMLEELNSIAEYFLDDDGYRLIFRIVRGSDTTFLWKLTVRVQCSKCKTDLTDVASSRLLNLHQMLNIYNTIKQQAETLKMFQPQAAAARSLEQQQPALTCAQAHSSNAESPTKTDPKLFDMINSMSETTSNDDDICCICMEDRTNVILACTHNFCENCIREWHITSNTCPICRNLTDTADCFVLTQKPDYYHLQDEMSKSLFQITDGVGKKRLNSRRSLEVPRVTAANNDTEDSD